jgi:hypothetical protein
MTHDLEEGDPQKFSISTPQRGSSAFMRVLESVPSSERIIHEVKNVFKSLEIVRKEKGVKVDGVGNSNAGVRYLPRIDQEKWRRGVPSLSKGRLWGQLFCPSGCHASNKGQVGGFCASLFWRCQKGRTEQKEKQAKKAEND